MGSEVNALMVGDFYKGEPTGRFFMSLVGATGAEGRIVELLSGQPYEWGSGDLFWPIQDIETGERDAVRQDLLRPLTPMEVIAWAAKGTPFGENTSES